MMHIAMYAAAAPRAGVLAAAILLSITTACASRTDTHLDCPPGVSFQGRDYAPWPEKGDIDTGRTVGTAMAPATVADPEAKSCDRTTPLEALAIEGVSPAIAFVAPDGPGRLYVSEDVGSLAEMPPALQRLVEH